ncbi:neuronal acetylcholine receptor subunit alpha-3 [Elysia marginata]|uniref:Neuronal acetylcholine receptor subunit alpha-3 n=1 Tax=Elysia marginata TaxID=1093978 RepID=A0AAV4J199_9GAST|nr:neuronal acetylcholine receptor subunit alpha-3 [Elysia marginata]
MRFVTEYNTSPLDAIHVPGPIAYVGVGDAGSGWGRCMGDEHVGQRMTRKGRVYLTCMTILRFIVTPSLSHAASYHDVVSLTETLVPNSSRSKPLVRPLLDQNDVLLVTVGFVLLSIVEVDEVYEIFSCNGFLVLNWDNQVLRWNASDFGGVSSTLLHTDHVFTPRIELFNTVGERDPFRENTAPVAVRDNGRTTWIPGNVFHVNCKLKLTKFPFDKQTCIVELVDIDFPPEMLSFVAVSSSVLLDFYSENGEWEVESTNVCTDVLKLPMESLSSIAVSLTLKRKPKFLVLSVLLPIVFLSLMNLLVFIIPKESGELKINFGVTVLLALTVFQSLVLDMLPPSSESMPLIISYIFILLSISVLSVVVSVFIVRLHHIAERKEKAQKAEANYKAALYRIGFLGPSISPPEKDLTSSNKLDAKKNSAGNAQSKHQDNAKGPKCQDQAKDPKSQEKPRPARLSVESKCKLELNRYRAIAKYIDRASLVLFSAVWVSVTVAYLAALLT